MLVCSIGSANSRRYRWMSVKFSRTSLSKSWNWWTCLSWTYEHISVEGMDMCVDIVVELIKLYTEGC